LAQLLDSFKTLRERTIPQLTATDLANAWAYAEAFPDEIAEAIAANQFSSLA
jgi:hypothetical protein